MHDCSTWSSLKETRETDPVWRVWWSLEQSVCLVSYLPKIKRLCLHECFISVQDLMMILQGYKNLVFLDSSNICYSFETNAWQDYTRVASLQGMWYRKTPSLMRSSVISDYWTAGFGRLVLTRRNYDILDFLLDAVAGIFCIFQFLLHGFVAEMSY